MKTLLRSLLSAILWLGLLCTAQGVTVTWTNTAGGSWKTATNWSPNKVPGSSDNAVISLPGTYTVTVNANASVGNLTLGDDNSSTPKLSITAGTFKISTNGVATVRDGAVLDLVGGILDGDGRLSVVGTMNWTKNEIRSFVAIAPSGRLNVSSGNLKFLSSGILDIAGVAVWSDNGTFKLGIGSAITNRGVFEVQNDLALYATNKTVFVNQGTFRKINSSGITPFNAVEFRNSGTIELQTGGLGLMSGKHSFSAGSRVIGPGSVSVSGAELTLSGVVSSEAPLDLNSGSLKGTFNLAGDLNYRAGTIASGATITGTLNVLGGDVANPMTVTGAVNLSSGKISGGLFTLNGDLNWTGGTMSSTKAIFNGNLDWSGGVLAGNLLVQKGRTLNVADGPLKQLNGGVLTNQGTVRLEAPSGITCDNASMIYNYGSFLLANDTPFTAGATTPSRFYNHGSLIKAGAGQLKWEAIEFHNRAIVDVPQGILALGVRAHSLGDNSAITGAGRFQLLSGSLALGNNVSSAPPLEVLDGALTAAGTFDGNIEWTKGSLAGVLTVPVGRQIHLTGNGTKTLAKDSVLNVAGTALLDGNGGLLFFANATINNSGSFDIQNSGGFSFNGSDKAWFNNTGTLRKVVSTATLPFGALQLVNSGTVEVQTGEINFTANTHTLLNGSVFLGPGALRVNGGILNLDGAVNSSAPLYLILGSIVGNGTFTGTLNVFGGQLLGTIIVDGPVICSGGAVAGTLTAKQTMDWSGGTISGTLLVPAGGSLTVKPGGTRTLTGVINNAGVVTVRPLAFITLVSGTPLVNSGLFEVQDSLPFKLSGSSKPIFNNSGTFRKTSNNGTLSLSFLLLQNTGTLDVQAGGIDFTLNAHTLAGGSRLVGPGPVRIAGATVTMGPLLRLEGPLELVSGYLLGDGAIEGSLAMSGGQLPGVVLVTNAFTWSGGEVKGTLTANHHIAWSGGTLSGTLNVPAACQFDLQDGDTKLLTGTLNNYGTLSLLALSQVQMDSGCVINNAGLCETWSANPFAHLNGGTPTFNNTGTFRKLGAGDTAISLVVIFNNTGLLDVASNSLSFISGTHTFSSGSRLTGAGVIRVAGAMVNWNGAITNTARLELASGLLNTAGSLNGALLWSGGALGGLFTVAPGSELRLVGTTTKTLDSVIVTNRGAMILEGSGALAFFDDAIIENNGLFELQAANSFTMPNSGKKWFNNHGIFRKTGSGQTFVFSNILLQNNGTLDLESGDLTFSANSHSFADGTRTMGPGTVHVIGGTLNVSGTNTLDAPFELASGILAGTATLHANGAMAWSGGTIPGFLNVHGNTTWTAGELSGTLVESDTLYWAGGLVSGTLTVPVSARLNVLPGGNKSISGVLQNAGTTVVSNNANIVLISGTPIVNSGVFEVQNEQALKPNGTTKVNFINSGTFRKTTSTKLMKLQYVLLQNSGTLDVQAGELSLALNLHSFADGTRTTGNGAVRVAGATLNVAGSISLGPALALDSGYLTGNATLNGPFQVEGGEVSDTLTLNGQLSLAGGLLKGGIYVQGAASWTGGEIAGWLSIATNSALAIGGAGIKTIKGGTLTNSGLVTVTSPVTIQGDGGAEIQNYGGFNLPVSVTVTTPWGGKPTFNNYGVLSLTNGFGVFNFPGHLTLFPSGRLELELAGRNAGANFSQITGVSEVMVDGAMVVRTAGGFEPILGDRLEIIKCVDRIGKFATCSVDTPRLSPDYSLTNVTLTAAGPSITNQPQDLTVVVSNTATFNVSVAGTQPFAYQWCFNGLPLAGAVAAVLTLTNVQPSHDGHYSVSVSNVWGATTSSVARLTVNTLPVITQQPAPLVVNEGEDAAFNVITSGTYLRYQWRFGNDSISGATNAALFLPNVTAAQDGRYKVEVFSGIAKVTSAEVTLTVIVPPRITEQPASKNVNLGSSVTLSVKSSGTTPLSYQWVKDGAAIPGANGSSFVISSMTRALEGSYQVIVANPAGYEVSSPAVLLVNTPPSISVQPVSQMVTRGTNVLLSVTATGVPAPTYQWQLNGVNLYGATQPTLLLTNVQPKNSGNYNVVVANSFGTAESVPAELQVITPPIPFADNFADRGILYTTNGFGRGTNCSATKQAGEPTHAGKGSATNSVWISWWAPANGIATFTTAGSDFDTVLAVYRGTNVNALTKIAADDDSAGFHWSKVSFNAQAGTYYQIAVAGFARGCGDIILNWDLLITTELLPQITQAPQDYTGNSNELVLLQVVFDVFEPTAIQWFYQGQLLPGAIDNLLPITQLQANNVGGYAVRLTSLTGRTVVSPPGDIQINTEGARNVHARNKFGDTFESALIGNESAAGLLKLSGGVKRLSASVSRGYTGTQVFSTYGGDKEEGEPNHCGVPGGASIWFFYQPPRDGTLVIDTAGSSFDTVLAVYTGPGTDFASLVSVACDDNSGADGLTSKVIFNASSNTMYYIAVDGVNGASGTVQLNYALGGAPTILTQPISRTAAPGNSVTLNVQASGAPGPEYQWSFNGLDILGATGSSLTLSNFQSSDVGRYQVRVSNVMGSILSDAAELLSEGPLRLSRCHLPSNGCFGLRVIGPANKVYVIECTTNLVQWSPLATNGTPTGLWDFVDVSATNVTCRYYRVKPLP